jgi:uncharacterized protein YacL
VTAVRRPLARTVLVAAATLAGLTLGPALGLAGSATAQALLGLLTGVLAVAIAALVRPADPAARPPAGTGSAASPRTILDTSVIIDGRIVGVSAAGFLDGAVTVPDFVLRELRQIADSADPLRRNRGRRGLDVLEQLKRLPRLTLSADARDFPEIRRVDDKLIALARLAGGRIVTNDVALHRLATLGGVPALSVNELAQALRPVVLPGEGLEVQVVKEGREPGQGVGYLEDGTMVVVDQGRRHLGQTLDVTVTTVLQTAAGRMIFARVREEEVAPR